MNYNDQLNTEEWKAKREEIILRDNSSCTACNVKRNKILNLSKEFGINSWEEMKSKGYSSFPSNNLPKELNILNGSMMSSSHLIGIEDKIIHGTEFHFAKQWVEGNNFDKKGSFRYIHFDKNIQNAIKFDLNVHHKCYIRNKMAWEYNNEDLITLCSTCHKEEHSNTRIPIHNKEGEFEGYAENCPRCFGSGVLEEYYYNQNGVCFKCMGTGSVNIES